MAYDAALVEKVRRATARRRGVTERAMFGGVAFLLGGKMFCGVATGDLMVRVGPEKHAAALARTHVRPMDFTGRPMRGYVFVGPGGTRTQRQVDAWVAMGASFVATIEARPRPRARRSHRR
jgi:TfoX/Sxy family transcriptional regulator of competence genes